MKPRYFRGTGNAPIHLSSIIRERGNKGRLVFKAEGRETVVPFETESDLLSKLKVLLAQSVPMSVGGHCAGPADEVGEFISSGRLNFPYVEVSWSGPGQWTIREITGDAIEWEITSNLSEITNQTFNPDVFKNTG